AARLRRRRAVHAVRLAHASTWRDWCDRPALRAHHSAGRMVYLLRIEGRAAHRDVESCVETYCRVQPDPGRTEPTRTLSLYAGSEEQDPAYEVPKRSRTFGGRR